MKKKALFLTCALAVFSHPVTAADYLGAQAVLDKAAAAARSNPAGTQDKGADSLPKLRADLEAFQKNAATLPPKDAARDWLALVARSPKYAWNYNESTEPLRFIDFVKALPPPTAWSALPTDLTQSPSGDAEPVASRLVLKWFADRLLGDPAKLLGDYDAITKTPHLWPADNPGSLQMVFGQLADQTLPIISDEKQRTALLRSRLESMISTTKAEAQSGERSGNYNFPDVVLMVGEKSARELVTRALTAYPGPLDFENSATGKLATEIATADPDSLAVAQWQLTCSPTSGELYAWMLKRFGPTPEDGEFQEARMYEFYRLILAGNIDAACDLARQSGPRFDPSADPLLDAGRGEEFCEVLQRVLDKNPEADLWDTYISTAVRSGQSEQMLKFLDSVLARPDLRKEIRFMLESKQLAALLAAYRTDDAVTILRRQLAAAANGKGPSSSQLQPSKIAIKLATLGALVGRDDWFNEGLQAARSALKTQLSDQNQLGDSADDASDISNLLLDAGRGPEAESIWIEVLGACTAAQNEPEFASQLLDRLLPQAMKSLVGIYATAGRQADILTLADRSPDWGADDLATNFADSCDLGGRKTEPLGVALARALAATGRHDEAVKMLEAMMPKLNSDDPAYALLLELLGPKATPMLDQLTALDAFEERPLIWKAQLLLDAKKLDEAEQVARRAIAVDPSDGGEGPGDRMRAYAVLADILDAKGDAKQAKFLRGIVTSIRMSEHADVLYEQGLLQQAIGLYEKSLLFFSDAYCIQSRLALRLCEAGDWTDAEEHYRRAYELMPVSFGRVESHCFGCERAFEGKPQQSIAEQVFVKLAKEQPDKPQVHYLLGYLYEIQGRARDAMSEYQAAVKLDPDYLNAWNKLAGLPEAALSAADHNRIASNLIRLDPAGRHRSLDLTGVDDLPTIWNQLTAAQTSVPKIPSSLYPFPVSARRLADLISTIPSLKTSFRRESGDDSQAPGAIFSQAGFTNTPDSLLQFSASQGRAD